MKTNQNETSSQNENGSTENQPVEVKRNVGRPRTVRKELWLNPESKEIRGRGKPSNGEKFLVVTVDRATDNLTFEYGVTTVYSERIETVNRPSKAKKVKVVVNKRTTTDTTETETTPVGTTNPNLVTA